MNMDATVDSLANFAGLYAKFMSQDKWKTGEYQNNMRVICGRVRDWAKTPQKIGDETVDLLIWKRGNGIANVGNGGIPLHGHAEFPHTAFLPILKNMLATSAKSDQISRMQYISWREDFFATAGYKANVVFNRLVFACFPKQFCSVIDLPRLCAVCKFLQKNGYVSSNVNFDRKDWFELCEFIVPIVRTALPDNDFADHSMCLAAIGVMLNKSPAMER